MATKTTKKPKVKKECKSTPPKRLNKLGQWMKSDAPPLWDLSDLTPREYRAFMRQVMK